MKFIMTSQRSFWLYKSKSYDVVEFSSGIISIRRFVKISQLVQKLQIRWTSRHTDSISNCLHVIFSGEKSWLNEGHTNFPKSKTSDKKQVTHWWPTNISAAVNEKSSSASWHKMLAQWHLRFIYSWAKEALSVPKALIPSQNPKFVKLTVFWHTIPCSPLDKGRMCLLLHADR
jgi:hypothetical protein